MNLHKPFLGAGFAALLALVIATSAFAADFRSPDTREAAAAPAAVLDQRSPDTTELANSGAAVAHRLDALEQARGSSGLAGQQVFVVDESGLNWTSAAIGAAATFGLILVLVGTATAVRSRRVHPI